MSKLYSFINSHQREIRSLRKLYNFNLLESNTIVEKYLAFTRTCKATNQAKIDYPVSLNKYFSLINGGIIQGIRLADIKLRRTNPGKDWSDSNISPVTNKDLFNFLD